MQFIIVTKSKKAVRTVEAKYDTMIDTEEQNTNLLKDEKMIVSDMTESEAKKIEKDSNVELVEQDTNVAASTNGDSVSSSNLESTKWNLKTINADKKEATPSKKVKIALLDSGVDFQEGITVKERINLINDGQEYSPMFEDATNHGTSIASIIAGSGGEVQGVNQDVELYSARILDDKKQAPISRVVEGIYWAIDKNVNIISISFGTNQYSEALKQAIDDAKAKGILVIAAAGNQGETGTDNVEYPAAFEGVMAVGSVDSKAKVSDFSSTGKEVDVVAPGEVVRATGAFGETMITSGTSMSVPHVVGVASRLWQKDFSKSGEFIKDLVKESAKPLGDTDVYGSGLVDYEYANKMYNTAAKQYSKKKEVTIQSNQSAVETYANKDESKVEGTWSGTKHQQYLTDNSSGIEYVSIMKEGAIYPDQVSFMARMETHPDFHGYYKNNGERINYLASYRCIIKMADAYGRGETYTAVKKSDISGLMQASYDDICKAFKSANSKIKSYSKLKQRKAFVFGIAMHSATDAFAHSTFEYKYNQEKGKKDWIQITHQGSIPYADDSTYQARRFKMAYRVERNNVYRYQGKRKDVAVCHDFHAAGDTNGTYYVNDTENKYYRIANIRWYANEVNISDTNVLNHYSLLDIAHSVR